MALHSPHILTWERWQNKNSCFPPRICCCEPHVPTHPLSSKGLWFSLPCNLLNSPQQPLYRLLLCFFFSSALTYMGTRQGLRVEWKFRLCSHWPKPKILPQIKLPALLAEPASPDRASSPHISSHRAFAAELKAPGCLCFARKQPHRAQVEG